MFNGYMVALVTPFENKRIDFVAFERYINYLEAQGVGGIVACGSTGESLSLSVDEKVELIKAAAAFIKGKTKLIGGIIDSSTDICGELIKKTEEYVDGFLCICPFYLKPSQEQICNHFKKLSELTSRDIILYNNPSRGGADIGFNTFCELTELPNITALKECANDVSRFALWRAAVHKKFSFLTGNDDTACGALAMGAHGVVSVSANVAPDFCNKMYDAFSKKDLEKFSILRDMLAPLHEAMFEEPSPAPVKYALSKLGLMSDELRAPLSPIGVWLRKKIDDIMIKLEII
jgi:4-hydroxy-tetrahydrodipicolinate synthase